MYSFIHSIEYSTGVNFANIMFPDQLGITLITVIGGKHILPILKSEILIDICQIIWNIKLQEKKMVKDFNQNS